jgi:hypothetical protein
MLRDSKSHYWYRKCKQNLTNLISPGPNVIKLYIRILQVFVISKFDNAMRFKIALLIS